MMCFKSVLHSFHFIFIIYICSQMSTENNPTTINTEKKLLEEPDVSLVAEDDVSRSSQNEASEELKKVDSNAVEENNYYTNLPESLQHLTHDELKALEKTAIRKVDWRLLPMMAFIYFEFP